MARVTVGVVFHTDDGVADEIIQYLKHTYNIDIIHVQQSFGKLWIKKGDQP